MPNQSLQPESYFKQRVIQIIQSIPHGQVMSYGQVAACAGVARAARQVGWILNKSEHPNLPWWRVINNSGKITIKGAAYSQQMQADLLQSEGVNFIEMLQVDIRAHRYLPTRQQLQHWLLPELYVQEIIRKYQL